jgi:Zn finger protein HypA/HybF involved in hydrogenase expression
MAEPTAADLLVKPAESQAKGVPLKEQSEIASAFCPSCSARLAQRSCKLICPTCGYYMSCSDFY